VGLVEPVAVVTEVLPALQELLTPEVVAVEMEELRVVLQAVAVLLLSDMQHKDKGI
jgi:hypothetical protein